MNMAPELEISQRFWDKVMRLLPPRSRPAGPGGRPRVDERRVLAGVLHVLRTGRAWKEVSATYGSGSTVHRYFLDWCRTGLFPRMWRAGLAEADEMAGVPWTWHGQGLPAGGCPRLAAWAEQAAGQPGRGRHWCVTCGRVRQAFARHQSL